MKVTQCWRVLRKLDNRDWHVYGGLVVAGVGGWFISPQWTCVVVGGALVVFGLFGGLLDRMLARRMEDSG